ncbi:MAG TPA: cytochrome c [Mycobacteriales bacterium]|jgi:mono/diheme cytochrome c family protein|nr:cytochrome c [Mycobacteriales bacterium]
MSDVTPRDPRTGAVVRRRKPLSVPIGFRPAPSDDELETNVLERWQGWGTLLLVFLALFLPLYFVFFENQRSNDAALRQREESIRRGAAIFAQAKPGAHGFQAGCARCHGTYAGGGVVPQFKASADLPPSDYAAPALNQVFKRQIVDAKKSPRDAYRYVYDRIAMGVPGTPMPTWGLGYGGPMNNQQIEDVINYLLSIQVGLPSDVASELALSKQPGSFSRLITFAAAQ